MSYLQNIVYPQTFDRGGKMETANLLKQIKNKLNGVEKEAVVSTLGYGNKKKGVKRLNLLLSINNTEEWLKTSGYDFVHSNRSFLIKLCDVLCVEKELYMKAIKKASHKLKRIAQMPEPYIFINTNFKRKNEPIFALAFSEGRRRIKVDKTKVFESRDDGLSMVRKLVINNYNKTDGSLPMWGKIDNYFYHVYDKIYILSREGKIQSDKAEIFESKATLLIGNQEMNNLFQLESDNNIEET